MRLFRTLLLALFAVVALTAGMVAAAVVAVGGAVIYLASRMLRIGPVKRRAMSPTPETKVSVPAKDGDVIDVTATEVR